MADSSDQTIYMSEDVLKVLVKASLVVQAEIGALAQLYYLRPEFDMASSGSQGFVRGRGGFQPPRNVTEDSQGNSDIFRLSVADYSKIVSYLEIPENFAAITGGGRKTVVGKKYGSKMVVFKSMLAAIQHHGFPSQIKAANLQKRFQRYVKRYKDAVAFKTDTGGGLTEAEIAAGITLKEKLERMCPHFDRMHALYGERPNIAPPVLCDAGVEDDEFVHSGEADGEGYLDEDMFVENTNPNVEDGWNSNGPATPLGAHAIAEPPPTLQNHEAGPPLWEDTDNHLPSCKCTECKKVGEVRIGENRPEPTQSLHDTQPVSRTQSVNAPSPILTPTSKKTKSAVQAAKEVAATAKPTFTSIYADRISQKADYRKDLIQSRDKWKTQELAERRQARLENEASEMKKVRLERKHQLALECVVANNARQKAHEEYQHAVEISISKIRAQQEHEKEMAKAARKTALLTTLFGSTKSPAEIKDLLPIIKDAE